ncbi:TPA: hypothetical protein KEY88_003572 [Serratia marcescens]|nr:hypothetical protein [Serratia marcescens]
MITKNFRLNALANQYSAALYDHLTATSGGEHFVIATLNPPLTVEIVGGVKGIRQLVDSYFIEALQQNYGLWEAAAIRLLEKCVTEQGLTAYGAEIWQSMVADMASTIGGGHETH